jgi:hypothetical protein
MNQILDNGYSSTEYNEGEFKYRFSVILNRAFSFLRLLKSDGRLLKLLIPA